MTVRPTLTVPAAALLLAASSLLVGCTSVTGVTGSGNVVEFSPDVEPFTGVRAGSAFEVTLREGDVPGVIIRTDDNLVDGVRVTVSDSELSIGLDASVRDGTLEAEVSLPAQTLESVTLDGAASLTAVENLSPASLDVAVSGASRAFVVVDVDALTVDAEGASLVNASGTAAALTISAVGASSARLTQLEAVDAVVDVAGASRADVTVTGSLTATAEGASSVRYGGDPSVVEDETSGASSISRG